MAALPQTHPIVMASWTLYVNAALGSLVIAVGAWLAWNGLSPYSAVGVAIAAAAFLWWHGTTLTLICNTKRTPAAWRAASIRAGSKSALGIASAAHGSSAAQHEASRAGRVREALAGRPTQRSLEQRVAPRIGLAESHAELETGRSNQRFDQCGRRDSRAGFDPPDRRLRNTRPPTEFGLGKTRALARLANQPVERHVGIIASWLLIGISRAEVQNSEGIPLVASHDCEHLRFELPVSWAGGRFEADGQALRVREVEADDDRLQPDLGAGSLHLRHGEGRDWEAPVSAGGGCLSDRDRTQAAAWPSCAHEVWHGRALGAGVRARSTRSRINLPQSRVRPRDHA